MNIVLKQDQQCDHEYELLRDVIRQNLSDAPSDLIFTTNANGLWDAFLSNIPEQHRQHYNCNACKSFIRKFGGIVSITERGDTLPVLWDSTQTPVFFADSVRAIEKIISRSKVTGVFYPKDSTWGTPESNGWSHFSIVGFPVKNYGIKTAYQAMAEKKEDFKNMITALSEFKIDAIKQAVALLKNDSLYRSEKLLGAAEWLKDVQEKTTANKSKKSNLLWRFVALAPSGFCHPRSSMIGTLLEDISNGLDYDDIKRRFDEKMHPLQYQRPQELPSRGNIEQAEKIVAKLGIENSLRRRFARIEEVQKIWTPRAENKNGSGGGVFSNLKAKDEKTVDLSGMRSKTITWEKFRKTVLLEADKIEFVRRLSGNYSAIVTAEDFYAPPIIQWDTEQNRNPFSWYLYSGGSTASNWGIDKPVVTVNAISLQPNMWNDGFEHQGKGVMFILDGCRDLRRSTFDRAGLALFPEILKSDLRSIRATIEAFSRDGNLSGSNEATACGYMLQSSDLSDWNFEIIVTSDGIKSRFKLDRWD